MTSIIDHESGMAIPAETQKSIAVMNEVASGLAELQSKYAIMPDVNTTEGYDLAKQERKEIGAVRTKVNKAHKAGKAFYLDGGRKIDGMKNDILKTVATLEDERKDAIKVIDDEQARIDREAAEKEVERIDAISSRLDHITRAPSRVLTIEQCISELDFLESVVFSEFEEFADAAGEWVEDSLEKITEKKTALEAQAAEVARLAEQKAEQDRQAAELQAQQDKIAADARILAENTAAAAKAETDRLAKIAQEDKDRAARIKREDDDRAAVETARLAAIEKARADAIEAEAAAKQKVIYDEAERVRIETERTESAETARLEGIEQERQRVAEIAEKIEAEAAERERVAANDTDKKKLQDWIDAMPEMKTKAGDKAGAEIYDHAVNVVSAIGERSRKAA
jgi:hypothetical protein